MSKTKDYSIYLNDIIEAIQAVNNFVYGLTLDDFATNDLVYSAVCRKFEIIGEASNRIPVEIQEKYSKIPWKQMKGLRNILAHHYDRVRPEIIWNVIQVNLSPLIILLNQMIDDLDSSTT